MSLNEEEIQKIINARMTALNAYKNLDRTSVSTAIMKQQDVAQVYERIINELDSVLKNYVNIE